MLSKIPKHNGILGIEQRNNFQLIEIEHNVLPIITNEMITTTGQNTLQGLGIPKIFIMLLQKLAFLWDQLRYIFRSKFVFYSNYIIR